MNRLTMAQAYSVIKYNRIYTARETDYDMDADLEETGHQYPGAAADFFDIPNR